jgi:hypothetical protein
VPTSGRALPLRRRSFRPGTAEKREGYGCGAALQARGPLASGPRFLIITNASTSTALISGKTNVIFLLFSLSKDTPGVILFYIYLSRSDITSRGEIIKKV